MFPARIRTSCIGRVPACPLTVIAASARTCARIPPGIKVALWRAVTSTSSSARLLGPARAFDAESTPPEEPDALRERYRTRLFKELGAVGNTKQNHTSFSLVLEDGSALSILIVSRGLGHPLNHSNVIVKSAINGRGCMLSYCLQVAVKRGHDERAYLKGVKVLEAVLGVFTPDMSVMKEAEWVRP
jgi:hypothetical protein